MNHGMYSFLFESSADAPWRRAHRALRLASVVAAVASLGVAQLAAAQTDEDAPDEQSDQEQQDQGEQDQEDDGLQLRREQHLEEGERPEPPGGLAESDAADDRELTFATGAGAGSDLAYASAGVVELGGTLSLTDVSETTTFRIAPSIGYFVVDNVELTLFPELTIIHIEETDFTVGGVLEPSYHLPFSDTLFGFVGLGVGLKYAEDPGVDLFFRPRAGIDVMVGRSGIFKPALFADIGVSDGLTAGGFEAGFTVML